MIANMSTLCVTLIFAFGILSCVFSETSKPTGDGKTVETPVNQENVGSKTDAQTVAKEEQSIKIDGLSVAQMKEIREKAEKHTFQAEVDRMMKLIINSLYKNKEIFLRELISNASDALDKIRFLALTEPGQLGDQPDLNIKIKANKETKTLHITDTGIGMTKEDLTKNLGTIAKSGTSEFLKRMGEAKSSGEMNDLIGQFGVGFYSSFLVADKVTVISKHNADSKQYIWESDASSFAISEDPRGNTLKRGTEIILHMKEDVLDYLEPSSLRDIAAKYSQFINFPIYLWESKTEMVDEEKKEEEPKKDEAAKPDEDKKKKDEDATVEEEKEKAKKPEPKKVEKTTWNWVLVNENKPIWTRKPAEVKDDEYNKFYKAFSKDYQDPLAKTHFIAEGEVTFKSILFIPAHAPHDMFKNMQQTSDNVKLYVKRVFISDKLEDMMPNYLSFVKGIVDSDDLPLNVSRETLQQSKLIKVIKKKLVRKVLDMIKKLSDKDFEKFWKEFSTSIKLGVIEDNSNRTRLSKLLRFWTSHSDSKMSSLSEYVQRMKEKQKNLFFIAGDNKETLKNSPLAERVLKKGYEVIYCLDPIDEYAINALPDFEGKKFQNLAKEGLDIEEDAAKAKEKKEQLAKDFAGLMEWLKNEALKDKLEKVEISDRLLDSPAALVATTWGYSGNMERIMRSQAYKKSEDPSTQHMMSQKRILEINPRHPLIKELKTRVSDDRKSDTTTKNMAVVLYETAVMRSGYILDDMSGFASRVEHMMRLGLNVPLDEKPDYEEGLEPDAAKPSADSVEQKIVADGKSPHEKKTDEKSSSESKADAKDEL